MDYLTVKWLHVISSTILFGTGLGSAYYMLLASLNRNPVVAWFVVRKVVVADWVFTATAVVIQPVTGLWLAHAAGIPLSSAWIAWSIALYVVAGACWLPVVWLQYRMREMAHRATLEDTDLPPVYWRYLRIWIALGVPAFVALVVVFWLMVAKPV